MTGVSEPIGRCVTHRFVRDAISESRALGETRCRAKESWRRVFTRLLALFLISFAAFGSTACIAGPNLLQGVVLIDKTAENILRTI